MKGYKDIRKVAVIGCGVIGYSWGVVFARKGIDVVMYNRPSETLDTVKDRIRETLDSLKEEGYITAEQADDSLSRISVTSDLEEAVKDADYIQECLSECLSLKQDVFKLITDMAPTDVPVASSTSGLKISDIAAKVTNAPERCILAHPANPPHVIPFMEISGDDASPEIKQLAYDFMESMGQKPVQCKEVYGYVFNRLQWSLVQEAIYLVKEDICSVEAVERALTEGLALRWAFMGPFSVSELTSGSISETLKTYKKAMLNFFNNEQKTVEDYGDEFIDKAQEGVTPLMNGMNHDEFAKWRDHMIIQLRQLKEKE